MALDFYRFETSYTRMKNEDRSLRKIEPVRFYHEIINQVNRPGNPKFLGATDHEKRILIATAIQENESYQWNRPYYKVYPSLVNELAQLKLEIPPEKMKLPFPALEVRFYKGNPHIISGYELRSALVSFVPKTEFSADTIQKSKIHECLVVQLQFTSDNGVLEEVRNILPIYTGKTLEENMQFSLKLPPSKESERNPGMLQVFEAVLRTIIGVSFFSMDNHELIMPDLPRKVITSIERSKTATEKKDIESAHLKKEPGYKVGKEIVLPRPLDLREPSSLDSSGRKFKYGHLRSGHLRLQRYGSNGDFSYETIFIAPTVVRDDLPMKDRPGFKILKQE